MFKRILLLLPTIIVAVRYCFRNIQYGDIYNRMQLPLFPFRTDNW